MPLRFRAFFSASTVNLFPFHNFFGIKHKTRSPPFAKSKSTKGRPPGVARFYHSLATYDSGITVMLSPKDADFRELSEPPAYFVFGDHLGSTRLETLYTWVNASQSIHDNMDYLPFGEQIAGATGTNHKFTGKERDSESGLDNFGARYYSSTLGRFAIPDWAAKPAAVPYAVFGNPQSLNLYSYVGNNPTTHGDPDGHCYPFCDVLTWAVGRAAADGGLKPFAKNVAIGAAKGAGTFAYNTAKTIATASPSNPAPAVIAATTPGPQALQPSNQTQAQVSAVTQVSLTVATVLAPGMTGGGASNAAEMALNTAQQGSRAGAMIGAYDTQTGVVSVGVSGDISRLGTINPQITAAADQVGGIGAVNPGATAPVGCCAEVDAANQLANAGSNLGDIDFTQAIRPRTGEPVPPCSNCQQMFPQIKKPD